MKYLKILMIPLLTALVFIGCSIDDTTGPDVQEVDTPDLIINEFMASNDGATIDPDDDLSGDNSVYDDWFEIYNADSVAVDIGGMYVTDDLENPDQWKIPATDPAKTTIQPGGFLVIWADGEPDQGVLHADFALSGGGEAIGLVMSNGRTLVDQLTYEAQQTDFSYGRNPDGSDNWQVYAAATPGASNTGASTNLPPQIANISVSPDSLSATTPVVISAEVTDADDNLESVTITYGEADAITNTAAMTLSGSLYEVNLGTFIDGTRVFFYITATDDEALSTSTDTLSFEVGYIAPVLFINEFMASNDTANQDEYGEFEDWIEIYNPGSGTVDIGGMYITDGLDDLTVWKIPDTAPDTTTIQPGGFLVLYADKQPEQGVLHINVKLSGNGEQIGLTAPNGTTVIDSLTYNAAYAGAIGFGLITDKSCGRQPDGSSNWVVYDSPTPGASNQ